MIRNTNIEFDPESLKIIEGGHNCHRISKNIICSLDLKSDERLLQQETADETIYIPYDTNTFSFFTDDMTDHSYNLYMRRFYPAYLSKKLLYEITIKKKPHYGLYNKYCILSNVIIIVFLL